MRTIKPMTLLQNLKSQWTEKELGRLSQK